MSYGNYVSSVVSLRQLERSSTRERERASEHLATVEEHYTRQLNALTEKLRNVEAERNLMMVCEQSHKSFKQILFSFGLI